MISRIIIVAGLIAVAQGNFFLCRPNEVISFWPICSDKCSDMDRPCSPITITGIRCVCRSGHKRNEKGECVREQKCCTKPNEKYSENGETDRTCEDVLSRNFFHLPKPAKCICVEGTVRDGNQNCVPESQCYPTCDGENEVWKKNGTEENCNLNGNNTGETTTIGSGCFCIDGYFRNEKDQTCVLKSDCDCPGDNESYIATDGCEKDCMGNSCSYCGTPRCYCDEGYKRQINKDGTYSTCVKPEDCNCDP